MYTIKPIAWECISEYRWVADTVVGRLAVRSSGNRTQWYLCDSGLIHDCDSIDDGKAKAEAYYRERLLPALVPVPDGAQVVDVAYNPNPEGRT